ncbi:MAG TPA: prepilin-type N-terminal cleavage/methylation domain-containing protein [Candidatus Paceibacterota bacterium]
MKRSTRGFTLIELLVVVAIIGVLASIILVSLNSARTKARDAQRVSDLKSLQGALEAYFGNNGVYPNPVTICPGHPYAQIWSSWPSCWSNNFTSTLLPTVPADPINNDLGNCGGRSDCHVYTYCIGTGSNSGRYVLGVNLENPPAVAQTNPSTPVPCSIATGPNVYWISN